MTAEEIRKTLQREFVRTIRKPFVDAVKEYDMVRPGDRVAVCISGGKDSMLLGLLLSRQLLGLINTPCCSACCCGICSTQWISS